MKRKILILLSLLLLLLFGIGLAAYPIVSSRYTQRHQSQVYAQYQEIVEKADSKEIEAAKAAAEIYNQLLVSGTTTAELDTMDYDSLLNLEGNGVMGYIEIPAIDVLLPIYHGVGEDSLEHGAGHLPGTSLPIGGRGTHTVISAHTGMGHLPNVHGLVSWKREIFFISMCWMKALAYEVDQTLVVKPYQIDALGIDVEQDYVTPVTCTPYGVNSHRLLFGGAEPNCRKTEAPARQM